jgi:protein-L-isoaspartate(D-aspartate) O-methyltransferase
MKMFPPHDFSKERDRMVRLIERHGVRDASVLRAMRTVPRHRFVPESLRPSAYDDCPLPIGHEQTISQPFIVAYMTEALSLHNNNVVLEVGTGSGYQTAVLAELVAEVFTIEIIPSLMNQAKRILGDLGYDSIHFQQRDGSLGWFPEKRFDAIIVTAAPAEIPDALLQQLKIGAKMILPLGENHQELVSIEKTESGFNRKNLCSVRFVPLTGKINPA